MENNDEEHVCWFHGKLSRDAAETKLLQSGHGSGAFLVRESNTSSGDYVLSVLQDDQVIHYQIRKHGDDAFFSIDDKTTIHGLDTLIEYYQENRSDLGVKLNKHCKGVLPPNDTRRHGRTNLLHRATIQNNYTVVAELLKCGYRNLDAKNQYGQTAVHLAAKEGADEILKKLMMNGASVNCRDSAGYTPLHYACQSNFPSTVRMLLQGGSNVQARHTESGMVPIHEAALHGHKEVIEVLLSLNAPVNPRNVAGDVPADIAERNNNIECAEILRDYQSPASKEKRADWYHGPLDRVDAVSILNKSDLVDGSFLVRFSDKNGGQYVLSVMYHNQVYHFQIQEKRGFLYIDNGPYLESLEHVIEYYRCMPDGLPGPLVYAVPPVKR